MKRGLWAVALCAVVAGGARGADQPASDGPPSTGGATAAAPKVVPGRKQVEALLQTPAKLDFAQRKKITIGEIFDGLHQQHQISLRFDVPTLTAMLGLPPASPAYPAPRTATPTAQTRAYLPAQFVSAGEEPAALRAGTGVPRTARPPVQPSPAPASKYVPAPAATLPTPLPPPSSTLNGDEPKPVPATPAASPAPPTADLPKADAQPPKPSPAAPAEAQPDLHEALKSLLDIEIDVQNVDLERVSIATLLRQTLDAVPTTMALEDFPIPMTNAMLLDYLIEEDGLLITTRFKALVTKETRVYSVKKLNELPPEQIAATIRKSIRPWSWRSQINDLGDQLKGTPLPAETLTSIIKTGVQLAGAEVGVNVTPAAAEEGASPVATKNGADEAKQMEMVGNAVVNGLVTLVQATLSAIEMVHYAEPPTATIQVLGSKLVVTQSQAAHREIAELLKQLAERDD